MRRSAIIGILVGLILLSPTGARAYNILAVDMGAYWNNLYDQYFGAQAGYGAPGQPGERWYTMVHYSDLATADLGAYDVLLVQSGFTDDWVLDEAAPAREALTANSAAIASYVAGGGGLVAWSQPFPDGMTHLWDWAPLQIESKGIYHENPVEVFDPDHPVMLHSTDESLSGWQSSWHGWFEEWDPRLAAIARTGDYGSMDPRTWQALTLAGAYNPGGCGRMVFSMQDADYHAYQGWDGAQNLIGDALDWAGTCSAPIPEHSTLLLLGLGLCVAAVVIRRRH